MTLRRRILLLIVVPLVLAPWALLLWVATTERGLQWTAAHLGKLGKTTLRIENVSGTLAQGFHLGSFDLQHPRVHLHLKGVDGKLELLPLLWQTISAPQLHIADALVDVRPNPNPNARWDPRFLPRLLKIRSEQVDIDKAVVLIIDKLHIDVSNLHAAAAVYHKQVRVFHSTLDLPAARLHLQADGRVLADRPIGYQGQVSAQWSPARQPVWDLTTRFEGSLEKLALQIATSAPFHSQISGAVVDVTKTWQFIGKADVADFDLARFGAGSVLGLLQGKLDISASAAALTARGTAQSSAIKVGAFNVDFDGTWAHRDLAVRKLQLVHQSTQATAQAQGVVHVPVGQRMEFVLNGDWQQLRYPLQAGGALLRSTAGRFSLEGSNPWRVQVDGDLLLNGLQSVQTHATGLLEPQRFTLQQGRIDGYGGTAQLQGRVIWSGQRSWTLTGNVQNMDLGQWRSDLPGRIGFGFAASSPQLSATADLDLRVDSLHGSVRGTAARGGGRVVRQGEDWRFDGVELQLGTTHLAAQGRLGAHRDLQLRLDAPDLSLLDPQAQGRLVARGMIGGSASEPVLTLRAQGANFALGKRTLRRLDADIDIDLHGAGELRGRIKLDDLLVGGRRFALVQADIEGTSADNTGFITVDADGLKLLGGLRGSWHDGRWQGQIRQLDLGDGGELKLALASPASLSATAAEVQVESLCVTGNGQARLCGQYHLVQGAWQAQLEAQRLPLSTLTAGLSQNIDYEGRIDIQANASGQKGAAAVGSVHATLSDAGLRHRFGNGREERYALGNGEVDGNATADAFTLRVGLDAGKAGNINGRLTGQRSAADFLSHPIQGELSLETDGLGLIAMYSGDVDRSSGRMSTRLTASGTLTEPDLQGELHLRDVELDVYRVNFALRKLNLDAQLIGDRLQFDGSANAGDGSARVNGQLQWRDRKPQGSLHFEGTDLQVVNIPEARVHASPKIDLRIAGQRLDINGEVRIPYGVLEPANITNAITASSDEVLVGAPIKERSQQWQVNSDLTLILGDKVSIDTLGLKGRLTGTLRVQSDGAQNTRGSGELNVAEGKYAAFGRNLDIARGRLVFNNALVNDPGIDLRAQKVYPDITAGVNVRGSLRAPRMTFFSEPSIPQSQIASLILAGGSLETVQGSARGGAARNEMLAQGGAILAQQLGNRVGIEDVGIESTLSNDTSLVLGKYLSPRLYVSYGISLAEAINTVKLRYTIGDRWTLKTESGKAKSADMVYTILK
ncbi:MAG: translocation/assembly module TamB domain-containing protein [Proteobacteria bacterium]|nr:translocation/assembly module TamB domain-containing protein [Pseudomonadota bacterium]